MNVFFQKKKPKTFTEELFLSGFKCTRSEHMHICFSGTKETASQKDLLMPEIKAALTASLHNVAYVLPLSLVMLSAIRALL